MAEADHSLVSQVNRETSRTDEFRLGAEAADETRFDVPLSRPVACPAGDVEP